MRQRLMLQLHLHFFPPIFNLILPTFHTPPHLPLDLKNLLHQLLMCQWKKNPTADPYQAFSVLLYCHFFCFTLSLFISLWQNSRSEVGWGTISPSSSLTASEKFGVQRLGHAAPAEYCRSCKSSAFQLVTSNLGSRCWKWCILGFRGYGAG